METLASIMAGQGANPYQQGQGIAPLLSQFLLNQQLAQGQGIQGSPQGAPQMPQQPQMVGAAPPGIGTMGAAALPQLLAQSQSGGGSY